MIPGEMIRIQDWGIKMPRTVEEIDHDYTEECIQVGHKSYLMKQLGSDMKEHLDRCDKLFEEKKSLKPKSESKPDGEEHG